MDKWTELRTAYHVAQLGTVSAAADALGLHRATVNRHVDALEAELGDKIFIRHARGYTLTDLGQEVLRVAQKADTLIDDLAGRVRGRESRIEGVIRLTILASFWSLLVAPVAAFRARNPNCRVEVHATQDLARLEYGEAHIALRAGKKPDHPDYVVSRFARVAFNLYASQSYVAAHGLPEDESDLGRHLFVMPVSVDARLPFSAWVDENIRPEMIALSSVDPSVSLEAVSAGLGIGFVADFEAVRRGDLVPVLPVRHDWFAQLWMVTHVDLHRTQKVREMLSFIKAARPDAA